MKRTLLCAVAFASCTVIGADVNFTNLVATFTNLQGHVYRGVRLLRADSEGLLYLLPDGGGGGRVSYTNLSLQFLSSLGVPTNHIPSAAETSAYKRLRASLNMSKVFEVTYGQAPGSGLTLDLVFFVQPPAPAEVDRILRNALDSAVLVDPAHDILARAFIHRTEDDEELSDAQYSGALVYSSSVKRVISLEESLGVKRTGKDSGDYYLETEESKTFEGVVPHKVLLRLTLVYAKEPSADEAYDAAIAEVEKAAQRGLHTFAYVSVGDKSTRVGWKPVRDPAGGVVNVEYDAEEKTIWVRNKAFKRPHP